MSPERLLAHTLAELPQVFRATASTLRRDGGAEQPATAWERAAELLEEALQGHLDEPLTIDQAAFESGYTRRHLKRLICDGTIPTDPNGAVLRRHLPKKPGHGLAPTLSEVPSSRVQLARAVAGGD